MSRANRLIEMLRRSFAAGDTAEEREMPRDGLLADEQREQLEHVRRLLEHETVADEEIEREAQRQLREAAEVSLRRLHIVQQGRCPQCGERLRQHLFAAICENCGWNACDTPRRGGVRVHLADGQEVLEGDRCYAVRDGAFLLLRQEVVVARLPAAAVRWIEYLWPEDELEQRHREARDRLTIRCDWCNEVADPETDGFHMVQVAFGAWQERYCFCRDECYEAFRKMYPARVHRNCYERSCRDCNLCLKRYEDESEGIRALAREQARQGRHQA
jgi:hypothetical protein